MSRKREISGMYSKMNMSLLGILKRDGYIEDYSMVEDDKKKSINITLKYDENNTPAMTDVKIQSKPGRRVYKGSSSIQNVRGGLGIAILTTNKGLLTDSEARDKGIGGELLFRIW